MSPLCTLLISKWLRIRLGLSCRADTSLFLCKMQPCEGAVCWLCACVRAGWGGQAELVSSRHELSHEVHPKHSLPLEGELNCCHFFTFKMRRRPEGMKEGASSSTLPLVLKHFQNDRIHSILTMNLLKAISGF